jgi:hypothetical protein
MLADGGFKIMRLGTQLLLWTGLLAGNLSAGTIIQYELSTVDANVQRYTYHISGTNFATNQELRILFAYDVFGSLLNGFAGEPGQFDLLLFQPNSPPQASGVYSALALQDNPSLSGRFSVDFTMVGSEIPVSQIFQINQYDQTGALVGQETGSTVTVVPEPRPLTFAAAGLVLLGFGLAVRRACGRTA